MMTLFMIDGPDGVGKTTQVQRVAMALTKVGARTTTHHHALPFDPDVLKDDVRRAYWFAYERTQIAREVLARPASVHLLDRSHWTSYAVTGAQWAAELANAEVHTFHGLGIEPVTLFLDAPNDVLDARLQETSSRVPPALRTLDHDARRDAMRERYRMLARRLSSVTFSHEVDPAETTSRIVAYLRAHGVA